MFGWFFWGEIRQYTVITWPPAYRHMCHVIVGWTLLIFCSQRLDWYSNRHSHFTTLFPGPPGWAGARKKLILDFMVLGRITRGRHTDSPGGRHSIRTNQQSTSINPPFLRWMPFLPQPSKFFLAWNMLARIPSGLVQQDTAVNHVQIA